MVCGVGSSGILPTARLGYDAQRDLAGDRASTERLTRVFRTCCLLQMSFNAAAEDWNCAAISRQIGTPRADETIPR